jgi:hypothetical protein
MKFLLTTLFIEILIVCIVKTYELGKLYLENRNELRFNQIRQDVLLNPRVLTREEYRIIKSADWYNQQRFLIQHLTQAGYNMYNASSPRGSQGKWQVYLDIWALINTPLFKAMNE